MKIHAPIPSPKLVGAKSLHGLGACSVCGREPFSEQTLVSHAKTDEDCRLARFAMWKDASQALHVYGATDIAILKRWIGVIPDLACEAQRDSDYSWFVWNRARMIFEIVSDPLIYTSLSFDLRRRFVERHLVRLTPVGRAVSAMVTVGEKNAAIDAIVEACC